MTTPDDRGGLEPERIEALTAALGEAGELEEGERVTAIEQLEGGWSRFSHLATLSGGSAPRRLVVRVKAPQSLFEADLAIEYEILASLRGRELPIPHVFALTSGDDNPFGGDFFVMEHMPGQAVNIWRARDHEPLRADWEGERGIAEDTVALLAAIHSVDADEAPASAPRIAFEDHVAHWRGVYEEAGFAADPIFDDGFAWLRANPPAERRIGLVHGDYRAGNLLLDGGRVSGILDWELAHVGDVSFDLGYFSTEYMAGKHLRPKSDLLGGIADRSWFFERYAELAGAEVDEPAVRAYSVLGTLSLVAMARIGMRRFVDGGTNDVRRAWACYSLPGFREELTRLLEW